MSMTKRQRRKLRKAEKRCFPRTDIFGDTVCVHNGMQYPRRNGLRAVFSSASAPWWLPAVVLLTIALLGGVIAFAPLAPEVIPYKLSLAPLGGLFGFLLDRCLFPYASPASYLRDDWRKRPDADGGMESPDFPVLLKHQPAFCAAMLRQALLIFGGMLGVSMGL